MEDLSYTDIALTSPLYCKEESAKTVEHETVWHNPWESDGESTENSSAAWRKKWNNYLSFFFLSHNCPKVRVYLAVDMHDLLQ